MRISANQLAVRCRDDREFEMLSRHWSGSLRLQEDDDAIELRFEDGRLASATPATGAAATGPGHVTIAAPRAVWEGLLAPVPAPGFTALASAAAFGLRVRGHKVTSWQYYPAVRRLLELARDDGGRGGA